MQTLIRESPLDTFIPSGAPCSRCGGSMFPSPDDQANVCTACGKYNYWEQPLPFVSEHFLQNGSMKISSNNEDFGEGWRDQSMDTLIKMIQGIEAGRSVQNIAKGMHIPIPIVYRRLAKCNVTGANYRGGKMREKRWNDKKRRYNRKALAEYSKSLEWELALDK